MATITAYEVKFEVRPVGRLCSTSKGNLLTVFAANPLAAKKAVRDMAAEIAPGFNYWPTSARKLTRKEIMSLI